MRFVVARPSVDGNEVSGFEINDLHQIGTIDVDAAVYEDDQLLLDVLNGAGYIEALTPNDVIIDGDDTYLEIVDEDTYRPLLVLQIVQ